MSKRVFLCLDNGFPRDGSSSNYIEYLGLAILNAGYDVHIIGMDERNDKGTGDFKPYKGMDYVLLRKSGWRNNLRDFLIQTGVGKDDFVIVYTFKLRTLEPILRLSKKNGFYVAVCVVEWFRRIQLGIGIRGYVRYFFYWIFFYIMLPRAGNIIAISRHLEKHFKECGCHTLLMPILMEHASECMREPHKYPLNFIYSGFSWEKDCLDEVFHAVFHLPEDDRKKIHYHICGMKDEEFRECLGNDNELVQKALTVTTLHQWMEFGDYEDLLDKMDFVIIARRTNQTSLSNFPSKVPEMMAHGIVPVASRVGDYTDLYLNDGLDSFIFDGYDAEACETVIKRALKLERPELDRMSQNAKKTVEQKFYYGLWSEKLKKFIEESKNNKNKDIVSRIKK